MTSMTSVTSQLASVTASSLEASGHNSGKCACRPRTWRGHRHRADRVVLEGDRHHVATIQDLYGVSTVVPAERQALHLSMAATSDVLFSSAEQHQKDNTYRSVVIRSRCARRHERQQLQHYFCRRAVPVDGSQDGARNGRRRSPTAYTESPPSSEPGTAQG